MENATDASAEDHIDWHDPSSDYPDVRNWVGVYEDDTARDLVGDFPDGDMLVVVQRYTPDDAVETRTSYVKVPKYLR